MFRRANEGAAAAQLGAEREDLAFVAHIEGVKAQGKFTHAGRLTPCGCAVMLLRTMTSGAPDGAI
jgi:hypothetical protein